jgi:glycosyltransferase 2 family protein
MEKRQSSRRRVLITFLILIVVSGGLLVLSDLSEVSRVIQQANWKSLSGALLFTALSYVCISYSFAVLSRALGVNMKRGELAVICFVTTVLNHVVTTGGVAGLSIRYLAMERHGVPLRTTLAISALHFYLTSLDMLVMLPVGAAILLLNAQLSPPVMYLVGAMTVVLGCVAIISTLLIFAAPVRKWVLRIADKAAKRILRGDYSDPLNRFEQSMEDGIRGMVKKPASIILVMSLTAIDWIFSVAALGFCFQAFGPTPAPGVLISGFVLGIMAGVISMVPGGFGVQEGSMAGVFALLGVPFAQAVVAVLVFRAVYYLLPYLASLPFYWRLLRSTGIQPGLTEGESATW